MITALSRHRRAAAALFHALVVAAALGAALLLRFEFTLDPRSVRMLALALPVTLAVKLAVFRGFALRDLPWRYIGLEGVKRMVAGNAAASLAMAPLLVWQLRSGFPWSIYPLDFLLCLALMAGTRLAVRIACEPRHRCEPGDRCEPGHGLETGRGAGAPGRRILIYGAGRAGVTLLSEIREHPELEYQVVGFLDDNPQKRNLLLRGARVWGGRATLARIVQRERVDEVLLALPRAPGVEIEAILRRCRAARVAARRVPLLAEMIDDRTLMRQIREVRVEDLLGRPPVQLEESAIRAGLAGRVVLVTGAGGSIGGELCRQMARYQPAAIVGLDQSEAALYQIDREMRERFPRTVFRAELGSIQNRRRLDELFEAHRPHAVYHAAAYKHVPLMEAHLFEAIENNILGTHQVARAAAAGGAETVVLVSSDKAVRPVNIMGATKRMAELVCLAAGQAEPRMRFLAVRFGNVLGSSGSVIPLFRRQIAAGGPLTVTHPEMRRFLMTIAEAAQLVLQAAAMGAGGEVFALNMGEPVRILDLARRMIRLSGLEPDFDIRIEFSGIRPGEKLCEELSAYEENTVPTPHAQIRVFTGKGVAREALAHCLQDLRHAAETRDAAGAVLSLKELIPEYNPSAFVLERALGEPAQRALARAV
jgi:FlaA1/EpsC-like NDP-sugar epimerase